MKKIVFILVSWASIMSSFAQISYPYNFSNTGNPIINHIYTADPSPKVFSDGKLWLFASHDANNAVDYSTMDGYHVFSTSDLKNWTDHGEVLHSRDVAWGIAGGGWMWAPDGVEKNGKYYLYFPHKQKADNNGNAYWRTGVAIADKPEGPYIPEPTYIQGTGGTDPMCFIDDDSTAYLLFGTHQIAKLKSNMKELAETPKSINYGGTNFQEGAYMHKRDGKYYYSWTNFQDPVNQGFYAIGDSPYGPFTYQGAIGPRPDGAQDHHAIINFKDQWYYFYHIGGYNTQNRWNRRRVCIDYLCYNTDGTMKKVTHTTTGVGKAGVDRLCKESLEGDGGTCSTVRKEAESFSAQSGVQIESSYLGFINNGDYADYSVNVPCAGAYIFRVRVASAASGGTLTLKKGTTNLGSLTVGGTGGWTTWQNKTVTVNLSAGSQIFRLEFSGSGTGFLYNVDWFELEKQQTSSTTENISVIPEPADAKADSFTVFPNPSAEGFTLKLNDARYNEQAQVFTLDGKLLYNFNKADLSGNVLRFGKELKSGMYILSITGKAGIKTLKLIKK